MLMPVLISMNGGPERPYKVSGPAFINSFLEWAAAKNLAVTIRTVEED